MNASILSTVVSKALNRDVICIEQANSYKFFMSERDKNNFLLSPEAHVPAGQIFYKGTFPTASTSTNVDRTGWSYSFVHGAGAFAVRSGGVYDKLSSCIELMLKEWSYYGFILPALHEAGLAE